MVTVAATGPFVALLLLGHSTTRARDVAAAPPVPPPSRAYLALLPDGPAKRRFIIDCTGCHVFDGSVAFPEGTPRSRESWHERITSMYARFARGTGFPIIPDPASPDSLAEWLTRYLTTPPASEAPRPSDPRVTEFDVPVSRDLPHDLMITPDGKVIITGMFTAQMYEFDPATATFSTVSIPVQQANPRALHIDPDGTWWVLLGAPGMIARRTPLGEWATYSIGFYAHSVARDASGLWANGHFTGHPARLAHVDASTGEVTTAELPSETMPGISPIPYELRTGPGGIVWMSELHGGRVLSYDPRTKQSKAFEMPIPHSGPRRLDVAGDGTVWIPLYSAGELVALEPSSGQMARYPLPDRDALPYVVRVDDVRDAVWVATGASDAVYRFDRKSRRFETIPLPSRGALVRHLDIDARTGDVWAAYGASPGTIPARIARIRFISR